MNIKEETWIERFFDNELSEPELEKFHHRLKTDEVFREHANKFGEAHETVHHLFFPEHQKKRLKLKETLFNDSAASGNSLKVVSRNFNIQRILKIAAVFLVGFGLTYFTFQNLTGSSGFVNAQQVATNMVRLDALDGATSVRGQSEKTALTNIVRAYQTAQYEQVLAQIPALRLDASMDIYFDVMLIKGIAAYHLKQPQQAITSFQEIINSTNGQEDSALWWQVVVYLEEDKTKAVEVLKVIIEKEYATAGQAQELLEELLD